MKHFFLIAFSALLLWSCGGEKQFKLSGEVIPATDGKIILFGFKEGQAIPTDTAEIVKGKFNFKGDIEIPELKIMAIEGQNQPIAQLFVEPGNITMTVYPDSFEANVIKGSKAQDILQKFMDEMVNFSKKENDLKMRAQQAQVTRNDEEMQAIQFEYETMVENLQLYAKNFIKEYSPSPVAAYVYWMSLIQNAQVEELDSMLTVFEPIKTSDFVVAIKARADEMRPYSKGAQGPDFTLNNQEGTPFSLNSLKGKYVLVDFWATWCQPCMVDMPGVIELYGNFKNKGLEIVGVSLDRDKEAWLKVIKTPGMNWIHVWDMEGEAQGEVATKYGVTSIPHTVLLDKDGKIIGVNLRGEELKNKLSQLMP